MATASTSSLRPLFPPELRNESRHQRTGQTRVNGSGAAPTSVLRSRIMQPDVSVYDSKSHVYGLGQWRAPRNLNKASPMDHARHIGGKCTGHRRKPSRSTTAATGSLVLGMEGLAAGSYIPLTYDRGIAAFRC